MFFSILCKEIAYVILALYHLLNLNLMPYEEFHRLIGKAGLSIKEFAELLGMRPNSITNYNKVGFVPSHLAVIVSLISTMKDEGFDFYPILEKVQAYEKARIESQSK
ncbi:hypothetical protein D3C80_395350 [compost metagenome]